MVRANCHMIVCKNHPNGRECAVVECFVPEEDAIPTVSYDSVYECAIGVWEERMKGRSRPIVRECLGYRKEEARDA